MISNAPVFINEPLNIFPKRKKNPNTNIFFSFILRYHPGYGIYKYLLYYIVKLPKYNISEKRKSKSSILCICNKFSQHAFELIRRIINSNNFEIWISIL